MPAPSPPVHQRRRNALAGTVAFLLLAPGVAAGLVPALITGWDVAERLPGIFRASGAVVAALGAVVLLHAFARFALDGLGTPAPVAPTERLVVGGAYRFVRNPMYLAVLAMVGGQAAFFGSIGLALYGGALAAAFASFVRLYEEPTLLRTYGAEYQAYRTEVPAWLPRVRPWRD